MKKAGNKTFRIDIWGREMFALQNIKLKKLPPRTVAVSVLTGFLALAVPQACFAKDAPPIGQGCRLADEGGEEVDIPGRLIVWDVMRPEPRPAVRIRATRSTT